MNHRRPTCGALLLAAVLATAAQAQQGSEPMVLSSDPELAAMAEALLPDLAERSGLKLNAPVRIERRSRAELTRYLQAKLDEELPPEEARAEVDAYALLGLVPRDLDLRGVLLGLYGEQIAGFYEPDSTALFVMDDQPKSVIEPLLMHELVHAIQDQTADLSALTGPDVQTDRATAAQAAIEGHATLVMMEYDMERRTGMEIDFSKLPDLTAQLRPALEATRSQFPELAGAPRLLQEAVLFPYLEGVGFVQALWSEKGRVSPFGENLPTSSEQVVRHDLSDKPVEVSLDVSGGTLVDEDVLGRIGLDVLLEDRVSATDDDVADGWAGDRYALVELPDGSRGLAWYVLWEDAGSRDRFDSALRGTLGRLGGPATLQAVEVGARPATLLRVSLPEAVTVRASVADAP